MAAAIPIQFHRPYCSARRVPARTVYSSPVATRCYRHRRCSVPATTDCPSTPHSCCPDSTWRGGSSAGSAGHSPAAWRAFSRDSPVAQWPPSDSPEAASLSRADGGSAGASDSCAPWVACCTAAASSPDHSSTAATWTGCTLGSGPCPSLHHHHQPTYWAHSLPLRLHLGSCSSTASAVASEWALVVATD